MQAPLGFRSPEVWENLHEATRYPGNCEVCISSGWWEPKAAKSDKFLHFLFYFIFKLT